MTADPRLTSEQQPLIFVYLSKANKQSLRHVSDWTEHDEHIVGWDAAVAQGQKKPQRLPKRRTFRKDRILSWANDGWTHLDNYRIRPFRWDDPDKWLPDPSCWG